MGLASKIVGAVVKRLPAHGKDRAEELLLPLRDFERFQLPRQSAFTVVCDDGETKDLDVVEVLERHGVKGVFAVSPDLIGRPGFLSYDDLRQIRAAGHEIAFHGTTHDPFTGFADAALLKAAVDEGMATMAAGGLGTPSTLIYPFGRHNRWVRAAVAPSFACAFTTWFGTNQGQVNRYGIRRIPFGAYTGKMPATEAWYRDLIDRCAGGSCWPTLMLHPAAEGHVAEHNALLGRLIEHAQQRGIMVRTVAAHLGAATINAAEVGPNGASGLPGAPT
jgi:peptidoglycan/xylan/chitin deacetylase (PgdA/CDA1 family)